MAEKNSAQTNKQTNTQADRHYENNGHLAVNQKKKPQDENIMVCPITQGNHNYLPFYPPGSQHCSDAVYRREGAMLQAKHLQEERDVVF